MKTVKCTFTCYKCFMSHSSNQSKTKEKGQQIIPAVMQCGRWTNGLQRCVIYVVGVLSGLHPNPRDLSMSSGVYSLLPGQILHIITNVFIKGDRERFIYRRAAGNVRMETRRRSDMRSQNKDGEGPVLWDFQKEPDCSPLNFILEKQIVDFWPQ